jgi:hypothetical protein
MDTAAAMTDQNACARIELRTNMFVLATIAGIDVAGPVKIRNLSPGGALIEGDALPAAGEPIELRRGSLVARGEIAWHQDGRAGLRFTRQVTVADWMPGANRHQRRVDGIAERAKTGAPASFDLADTAAARFARIAPTELMRLASALDDLADKLAAEPDVVDRLGTELQSLDIASQLLRRMAGTGSK